MTLIRLARQKSGVSGVWLGWFELAAAQTAWFATVIPGFPAVPEAGRIGRLLWWGWMLMLGIALVPARPIPVLTLTHRQSIS